MKFFEAVNSMKASQDAKRFAPSSCSAENNMNKTGVSGIAVAVSFLLFRIIDITGIFIPTARITVIGRTNRLNRNRQPLTECMC